VSLPIFQSSTFEYSGESSYGDLRYIRLNNTPNHLALASKLADLEEGEDAVVTSSGMAAITTSLLALLSHGDHVLVQKGLYGGTHSFVTQDLESFGIFYDLIDENRPETWVKVLKPTTKVILVESISNPLVQVGDLVAVVKFARENNLVSMIDNTFASPVNFRPLTLGFDLCVHSATKYLNGHTDIVAGAVIGKKTLLGLIKHRLNHLGGSLDPHACFLLHRGLKTLALRVKCQNGNALDLARFLKASPGVDKVNYPGLEDHPNHGRARQLFSGFGGMLSFELSGGLQATQQLTEHLRIPVIAPSLGGVETLVTLPATTSHSGMPREERLSLGISDSLVRISVGIEAVEDLVADFRSALEAI